MNSSCKTLLLASVLCAAACSSSFGATVHVSVSGNDSANGSAQKPLRTINAALKRVSAGGDVVVGDGTHAPFSDLVAHSSPVRIVARHRGKARIASASVSAHAMFISGAQNLTVEGVAVSRGKVLVSSHPVYKDRQVAKNIHLKSNSFSNPGGTCITIRNGTENVRVVDNAITDCATGIGGPNYNGGRNVNGVLLLHNRMERFTVDALQFADWDNVTIDRNLMQYSRDPAGKIHNDIIQFTGNSRNVKIANNVLAHSTQLIFIQQAVGLIENVTIYNNLVYDATGYAVQLQGFKKLLFYNNTVWGSRYGGILVRASGQNARDGAENLQSDSLDYVISNNILSGFGTYKLDTAKLASIKENGNFVYSSEPEKVDRRKFGAGDIFGLNPGFMDGSVAALVHTPRWDRRVAPGALGLGERSPARDAGLFSLPYQANDAGGRLRTGRPDLGALEYGTKRMRTPAERPAP